MKLILTHEKRDEIWELLNGEQQEYIQHLLRRGKRTAFARALAMSKGIHITDSMSEADIGHFTQDWVLIDFFDVGKTYMSKGYKCKCGRTLRYVYVVQHKLTGEQIQLGKDHFEEHTMIPPEAVKLILNGMQAIDYELDELLWKKDKGWSFQSSFPIMPESMELPEDIRRHIELGLPLLDSQSIRLRHLIEQQRMGYRRSPEAAVAKRYPREHVLETIDVHTANRNEIEQNETTQELDEPIQFTLDDLLFGDVTDANKSTEPNMDKEKETGSNEVSRDKFAAATLYTRTGLASYIKEAILQMVEQGMGSARAISEMLVYTALVSDDRFVTGKLKIYPQVCLYLDELLHQDRFQSVEVVNVTEDRLYKVMD